MNKTVTRIFSVGVALGLLVSACHAAPLYTMDAMCGDTVCGTMEIDTYAEHKNMWLGGVEIEGQFVPAKNQEFHYIQSLNVVDDPTPKTWTDGTGLTVPFIDTPPGGYNADPFDFLVYYDEAGEFPDFYDRPSTFMLDAKTEADNKLQLSFETWLVCVIDEMLGANATQAMDDTYEVATLLGWSWGYSISYADVGVIGVDELADFTVTKEAFAWLGAPSGDWTAALGRTYGNAPNQDHFNVTIGDCEDCALVPEPSSSRMSLFAMAAMVVCSMGGYFNSRVPPKRSSDARC